MEKSENKQKKPSPAQQKVIDRMKEGWSLGWSGGFECRVWLQEGKVGCGGKTEKVTSSTAHALRNAGLIKCVNQEYPTSTYALTDKALK